MEDKVPRYDIKKLLKEWETIIKPVKKYIEKTGNPIIIVEGNEK